MKRFFEDGETVLFYGDSVTDVDRKREDLYDLGNGYPSKVKKIYDVLFPGNKVTFINKGVSGDRTKDLASRLDNDCLGFKPDFVSILIGVNDAWRKYDSNDPTSPEEFEKNYRTVLSRIKKELPGTKILIMEPYVLFSVPERVVFHEELDPFIVIERKLAREYADYYLCLEGAFAKHIAEGATDSEISEDGVHPTDAGHSIIAYEILKTLDII
ncbi:MAG: SGNH/GDSL hydrolase family protein [Lachnospiraceae bacterium]|nr:SGNH/GDSL hydrolase family protein [Lachnospiraceae bacterium]